MTISNQTVSVTVVGNGAQHTFSYGFLIPAKSHAQLWLTSPGGQVTLVDNAGWILFNENSPSGGTFRYPAAGAPLQAGYRLTLMRESPYVQATNFRNQSAYYPQVNEASQDYLALQTQQLAASRGRALQVPPGEAPLSWLPGAQARANRMLGFDSSGDIAMFAGLDRSSDLVTALLGPVPRSMAERASDFVMAADFGAKGDGVTDDAPFIQAALDTGRTVHLTSGKTYVLRNRLIWRARGQGLECHGVFMRAFGNFDIFNFSVLEDCYLRDLRIDCAGMSGGHVVNVAGSGRTHIYQVVANNVWCGTWVYNCNYVTFFACLMGQVRGPYANRVTGNTADSAVGNGRTDLVRYYACGSDWSSPARLSGSIGLWLEGEANSIERFACFHVGPGVGIKATANAQGRGPFGLVAVSEASADFSAFENVYIEAGEDFYFFNLYGHAAGYIDGTNWNEVNGVYIAPAATNIQIDGGKITSSRQNSIVTNGKGVVITNTKITQFNSAERAGRYSTIYVGAGAWNTRISNNELGSRFGIGAMVAYQVYVQVGSRMTVVCNNSGAGFFCDFVCDETNGELSHWNNSASRYSETNGLRATQFFGAHFLAAPVISGGVITNLNVLNIGNDFRVTPANVYVIGDGSGATVSWTVNGLGGLLVTLTNGGANYTWARVVVQPAASGPRMTVAGTGNNPQDITVSARGGGAVLLGNDRGIGGGARAVETNAVNYPMMLGGASGSRASVIPEGPDANIVLFLSSKGASPVQLGGQIIPSNPGTPTASLAILGPDGAAYRIPLVAV